MARKIIYTRYGVEAIQDNFKLRICQHWECLDTNQTMFDYLEFDFTNYSTMRDFIDTLEARGVEMAR
jgi:hypothetical protein